MDIGGAFQRSGMFAKVNKGIVIPPIIQFVLNLVLVMIPMMVLYFAYVIPLVMTDPGSKQMPPWVVAIEEFVRNLEAGGVEWLAEEIASLWSSHGWGISLTFAGIALLISTLWLAGVWVVGFTTDRYLQAMRQLRAFRETAANWETAPMAPMDVELKRAAWSFTRRGFLEVVSVHVWVHLSVLAGAAAGFLVVVLVRGGFPGWDELVAGTGWDVLGFACLGMFPCSALTYLAAEPARRRAIAKVLDGGCRSATIAYFSGIAWTVRRPAGAVTLLVTELSGAACAFVLSLLAGCIPGLGGFVQKAVNCVAAPWIVVLGTDALLSMEPDSFLAPESADTVRTS